MVHVKLNQLNKARVNFKHFGLLPQTSDVRKLHRDIELFFYEALEVFFDLKFDEISLARLIKRHRVKNYLLQAEEYLHQDLFTDCINSTAKAFAILFHNVSEFIHLEISPFDHFEDRKIDKVMKAIQRQFQVNQEQLNILKFGINLAEYERFKSIIPRLSVSDVGVIGGYLLNATSDSRSLEDAQFGLRFAIDAALRIQQNPLPKKSLRIESLRKFRAVQETMMIVYPESSDIEHIRAVGKGEILTGYYKNHDKEDHVAIVDDDELSYVPNNTVEEIT